VALFKVIEKMETSGINFRKLFWGEAEEMGKIAWKFSGKQGNIGKLVPS
jgi:hypothetical protein